MGVDRRCSARRSKLPSSGECLCGGGATILKLKMERRTDGTIRKLALLSGRGKCTACSVFILNGEATKRSLVDWARQMYSAPNVVFDRESVIMCRIRSRR